MTYVTSRKEYEIGERGFLMDPKYETLSQILIRLPEFENLVSAFSK